MENLRYRPKGGFNWDAEWNQLYILTKHWHSDMHFYKNDLRFLHRLMDKYLIWLTRKDNLDEMKILTNELVEFQKNCDLLIEKIVKHEMHLAELIENPFKYDSKLFRMEHEKLEDDIEEFIKDFRSIKKQTFSDIEGVLDKEYKKLEA